MNPVADICLDPRTGQNVTIWPHFGNLIGCQSHLILKHNDIQQIDGIDHPPYIV